MSRETLTNSVPMPAFDGTQFCAGRDQEFFFPTSGGRAAEYVQAAKHICAGCAFRTPCHDYALWAQGVPGRWLEGVWGGTTTEERDRERAASRQRRSRARAAGAAA